MAQYQSSLTGPQIDAALQDIAAHNSEAWAVGERDGEAVGALDITYHNNAKYYSDQATGAAARAEAAVPAGTSGAVFFDTAQTLTDAQKLQVYNNIGPAASNPNLLDNPWFTINQRLRTSIQNDTASAKYIVDRWKIFQYGNATVESDGSITFEPSRSDSNCIFGMNFPLGTFEEGVYYTISAKINGIVYSRSMPFNNSTSYSTFTGTGMAVAVFRQAANNIDCFRLRITGGNNPVNIQALKYEKGRISTLALDDAPNYATELLKCQRYLYVLTGRSSISQVGMAMRWNTGTNQYRFYIPLPVAMYKAPTASMETSVSNLMGNALNGTAVSASSMASTNMNSYGVILLSAIFPSTLTNSVATIYRNNSDKLILTAEI